jgi:hypothetical protein
MEVVRMLEEVKVCPDLLLRVMDGAILAEDPTGEVAIPSEVHI